MTLTKWVSELLGNEETQLTKLLNPSGPRPRSEPALELYSRAKSSVGVMYHSIGPNTGSHPGGRRILIKKKKIVNPHYYSLAVFNMQIGFCRLSLSSLVNSHCIPKRPLYTGVYSICKSQKSCTILYPIVLIFDYF